MNKITYLLTGAMLYFSSLLSAQTANDAIQPYTEPFRPGVNLGYFPGLNNENLADLAAGNADNNVQGIGAKSIRTGIFNEFVEVWGYDFLEETYDYFEARDLKENTVIVGFPAAWQRDQTFHCPDKQSTMFANLYDPIFDEGENGTPVNDNNFLALYLYRLVSQYQDHVRFWEIWNEPGSDLPTGFQVGWRQPGFPGNWWENNPDPCDNILHAPIYHYVRTLRVAYEVIKSVDPDAYVSVAGFGYPAFLDAVLRNTDNPVDGSPTAEYPLGGGAYFDVFGNHAYPHFDGTTTNFDEGRFERHSDRAADGIVTRRFEFEEVLAKYGYDGITYPLKPSIITEVNVPRKQFGDFIGGIDVQINYIIKAFLKAKTNKVYALHPYNMIERDEFESASSEFGVMGMYEKFNTPGEQVPTGEAIAYKTTSDLLFTTEYDEERTAAMQLPDDIRGHAFRTTEGNYIYALWAETSIDLSEEANAIYSFPTVFGIDSLELIQWDYAQNLQSTSISPNNIVLDARPIFLRTTGSLAPPPPPAELIPNLVLSLSSENTQPGIFNTTTLKLEIANNGQDTARDIIVTLPLMSGALAYITHSMDRGSYLNWVGEWSIPSLPNGETYSLEVEVFTLTDESITIFSEIKAHHYLDENSTPDNGVCCVPQEEDEAVIILNETDECICTTEFMPVCGIDGVTYNNACLAACAGIMEYTDEACIDNDRMIDLSLEMTIDKPTFVIYETVTASLVLRNTGETTARNIKVVLDGYDHNIAYANHTLSDGEYIDWEGDWQIPALGVGEAATLNLGLFTLQDEIPYTIFAQVVEAAPLDSDSSPGNNETLLPVEDDEALVSIIPNNNLNGNTAEFRHIAEKTSNLAIQQLLPNPATTELKVRLFSKKEGAIIMKVLNPQGQVLVQQKEIVKEGTNFTRIPIDFLPSGIYFMMLEGTGNRPRPLRFVKQGL